MKEIIARLDQAIILYIHRNRILKRLDRFAVLLTILGSGAFSFPFTIFLLLLHFKLGISMFLSLGLCFITVQLSKYFFHRWRPYYGMAEIIEFGKKDMESSFPSGHTAAAFAMAFCLNHYVHIEYPVFVIASLVGYSRVHLGHHYPSDVLCGGILGIIFPFFVVETITRLS